MEKILILTDHLGYTFTSLKDGVSKSINASKLKKFLEKQGYEVRVESLHSIPENCKQKGVFVFYPSSEVNGLFYKEYIEDILLDLQYRGLILLPRFELFRAHHNKIFMEMIRNSLKEKSLKTIKSYSIYDLTDLKVLLPTIENKLGYPMVIKMSSGSGARGVGLAHNSKELRKKVKKMSSIVYHNYSTPWYSNVILSKAKRHIRNKISKKEEVNTYPQEKLIIQNFIPNLTYDYKVLIFGKKYYVLKRLTRDNDFRASGSGKFTFPVQITLELKEVLNTAKCLYYELDTPMLSVDIAYDGSRCHVIEFQCVTFGPYALQFSSIFFETNENGEWTSISSESTLEYEIGNSLHQYIQCREEIYEK